MKKFFTINTQEPLLLTLPEDAVLSRLGRNRYLSSIEPAMLIKLRLLMQQAFALCHAKGRWKLLEVTSCNAEGVVLQDHWQIKSKRFAEFVNASEYLYLSAVTVGEELPRAISEEKNLFNAAVFDAVGSECADLAVGLLQQLAAKELLRGGFSLSRERFSVGYGGVELFHQQEIFQQLELEDFNMSLTETFIMQPEKSVTAFASVNKIDQ